MKRIFAGLILSILCCHLSAAQDGKKLIDIVNEIKAEQGGKQQQKRKSVSHIENDAAIGSGIVQEKKSSHPKEKSSHPKEKNTSSAAEQIIRLLEGNARFVSGQTSVKNFIQQRAELTKSQHPFAIVLSCADSRVPPELLFDESLGQLFIVRVAGNVVDSVALGSIEYAVEHLHTSIVVILGHEGCGAVSATIQGGEVPPNIGSIVKRIQPSVSQVKAKLLASIKGSKLLNECVEENVREQLKQSLLQSSVLHEMNEQGELAIVGAIYSLESGTVRFLSARSAAFPAVPKRNDAEDQEQ